MEKSKKEAITEAYLLIKALMKVNDPVFVDDIVYAVKNADIEFLNELKAGLNHE